MSGTRYSTKKENRTDILTRHLEAGIETAKGIDGDFVYITVGEAKIILQALEELRKYKTQLDEDHE